MAAQAHDDRGMVTPSPAAQGDAAAVVADAVAHQRQALDECQAKALLAGYGIAVPAGGVARSEDEAATIARRLDGPVALKAVGPRISHKTERGLVALNLDGDDAVRAAARSLLALTAGEDAVLLVERMVQGARELMIGMKRDPLFGPVVVFGVGGIFTEAHKDITLGVTPLSDRDIEGMLDGDQGERAARRLPWPAARRSRGAGARHPRARAHRRGPSRRDRDRREPPHRRRRDAGGRRRPGDPRCPAQGARRVRPPRPRCGRRAPDLKPLFAPRAVAVVGASDDPLKWGGSLLLNLIDGGFAGAIYPVNRRGGAVCGLPAFRSVAELPEAPDLALVTLGAAQVNAVVEQCGQRGIPAALVVAADFSEAGEAGAAAEAELVRTARTAGVTLIGPNCMGLIATHSGSTPSASRSCGHRPAA